MQITNITTLEEEVESIALVHCPKISAVLNELQKKFPEMKVSNYDGVEFRVQLSPRPFPPFTLIEVPMFSLGTWWQHSDGYLFGQEVAYKHVLGPQKHLRDCTDKTAFLVVLPDKRIPVVRMKQIESAEELLQGIVDFAKTHLCFLETLLKIERKKIQEMEDCVRDTIPPAHILPAQTDEREGVSLH